MKTKKKIDILHHLIMLITNHERTQQEKTMLTYKIRKIIQIKILLWNLIEFHSFQCWVSKMYYIRFQLERRRNMNLTLFYHCEISITRNLPVVAMRNVTTTCIDADDDD
jgi:hypothetical protein